MTTNEVIQKLKALQPILNKEGITLLGIFGSYARGDYTDKSDIDILYRLDNPSAFLKKYSGFNALVKLDEIKAFLAQSFDKKVDFVDRSTLNEIGEEFILKDLKYV